MALYTSSRGAKVHRLASATAGALITYSSEEFPGLAVALQAGLERFAEPWYRLRAVRVFRDESNLSANPDLPRSSAIPPLLERAYRHEGGWTDLRWYGVPQSIGAADPRDLTAAEWGALTDLAVPMSLKS